MPVAPSRVIGHAEMITLNGRKIDFTEQGDGPAVLFIPGSFSTPAAWAGIQTRLPQQYRFFGTSLCGYGSTEETRSLINFGIEHHVQNIEAVVQEIGEPVHLVGHSFGGTVALASALSGAFDVLSITTFEANPLTLIDERGHHELFDAVKEMSAEYETAVHMGEHDAASRIIDFWGGDGSFDAMPDGVKGYCRKTTFANVLDWHTAFSFEANMSDYGSLSMPVLLVRGGHANIQMIEITEALRTCLPNQHAIVIEGANHFLITSHPRACAQYLSMFLEDQRLK